MRKIEPSAISDFKNSNLAKSILLKIKSCKKPVTLMEVCGTHTVALFRTGIKSALPKNIKIVSGPGCPVCVTPVNIIEIAIKLAYKKGCVLFCLPMLE